jgi:hypothetical protein
MQDAEIKHLLEPLKKPDPNDRCKSAKSCIHIIYHAPNHTYCQLLKVMISPVISCQTFLSLFFNQLIKCGLSLLLLFKIVRYVAQFAYIKLPTSKPFSLLHCAVLQGIQFILHWWPRNLLTHACPLLAAKLYFVAQYLVAYLHRTACLTFSCLWCMFKDSLQCCKM